MASRRSNAAKDALARLAEARAAQDEAVAAVAEALAARQEILDAVDQTAVQVRDAVAVATKTGISRPDLARLCGVEPRDLAPRTRRPADPSPTSEP